MNVKPVTFVLPLVLATLGTVACGGKESLKQVQADRRAKLAEASQPLGAQRRTHNRSALLFAGGHPLGQTFTRLFGKPSKGVTTKLRAPSAPASSLFKSTDLAAAPPPLPTRTAPPRPPASITSAPEGPADPLAAFSSSARGPVAAEKRPPQVGMKGRRHF
jgi:hypothetical protein